MSRVFIQCKNNEPVTPNTFQAYWGLRDMGFECIMFNSYQELEYHALSELIVGGIEMIRKRLAHFNIYPPTIDYPHELTSYLGRTIERSTMNTIASSPNLWPCFVKSVEQKRLTGKVIRSSHDLVGCGCAGEDYEVYVSGALNIVSEYRVFVGCGEILGCKHYAGNPMIFPDPTVIEEAVRLYESAPVSYGIDFGVLETGETILIEVNDAWALGCYGLQPHTYAKFLLKRWEELTNTWNGLVV